MKNIDTAFRYIRLFTLVIVSGCLLLCALVVHKSYTLATKTQDRIYVLAGGKVLEAFAGERKDNVPVEARDHIAMFHQYFFSLEPDNQVIQDNIGRALYLADGSARQQYESLKENNYYAGIITGNISQRVETDSVQLDLSGFPYRFRYYGRQVITRPSSTVYRSLVTEGFLRPTTRSGHNPHGFLIERWATIENRDLKTEIR